MKKIAIVTVYLFLCIIINAASINKVLLDHNGYVTLFNGNDMQAAVDAAVDGDVIYLSLGTFKPITINKKITIRGIGTNSVIDGDVVISIPGSPSLSDPLLETLTISGTINVASNINQLIIRKCKMAYVTIDATVNNALIDRCEITSGFTLSSYINGMSVVNCKLTGVNANKDATNNITFKNCNFEKFDTYYFSGTIINSILISPKDSKDEKCCTLSSSVLINSLIRDFESGSYGLVYGFIIDISSVNQGCYITRSIPYEKYFADYGYMGDDGTIVGINGGEKPFTLEPSVPNVTSSKINLDEERKQLNVKLTVSPQ